MSTETHNIEAQTNNDMKNSALIVSVAINAFMLTTWLVVEASDATFALVAK